LRVEAGGSILGGGVRQRTGDVAVSWYTSIDSVEHIPEEERENRIITHHVRDGLSFHVVTSITPTDVLFCSLCAGAEDSAVAA